MEYVYRKGDRLTYDKDPWNPRAGNFKRTYAGYGHFTYTDDPSEYPMTVATFYPYNRCRFYYFSKVYRESRR